MARVLERARERGCPIEQADVEGALNAAAQEWMMRWVRRNSFRRLGAGDDPLERHKPDGALVSPRGFAFDAPVLRETIWHAMRHPFNLLFSHHTPLGALDTESSELRVGRADLSHVALRLDFGQPDAGCDRAQRRALRARAIGPRLKLPTGCRACRPTNSRA